MLQQNYQVSQVLEHENQNDLIQKIVQLVKEKTSGQKRIMKTFKTQDMFLVKKILEDAIFQAEQFIQNPQKVLDLISVVWQKQGSIQEVQVVTEFSPNKDLQHAIYQKSIVEEPIINDIRYQESPTFKVRKSCSSEHFQFDTQNEKQNPFQNSQKQFEINPKRIQILNQLKIETKNLYQNIENEGECPESPLTASQNVKMTIFDINVSQSENFLMSSKSNEILNQDREEFQLQTTNEREHLLERIKQKKILGKAQQVQLCPYSKLQKSQRQKFKFRCMVSSSAYEENFKHAFKRAKISCQSKSQSDIQLINQALDKFYLISSLKKQEREMIFISMQHFFFKKNEVIYQQGQRRNHIFIVISGALEKLKDNKRTKVLKKGDAFGKSSLLQFEGVSSMIQQTPKAVKCIEDSTLWGIDRLTFRSLVEQNQLINSTQVSTYINKLPILAGLTETQLFNLSQAMKIKSFQLDEDIIETSQKSQCFFIILEGVVIVQKDLQQLTLTTGNYFNEQALWNQKQTVKRAIAKDQVKVAYLKTSKINQILQSELMTVIYKNKIKNIINRTQKLQLITEGRSSKIMQKLEIVTYQRNEVVLEKESSQDAYLVFLLEGGLKQNQQTQFQKMTCITENQVFKQQTSDI